jgi:hypothetical protein
MKETEIKKRIKYFEDRVRYYFFEVFKMYEYSLNVSYDKDDNDNYGYTTYHPEKIGSCQFWIHSTQLLVDNTEMSLADIDKVAYHEVVEAMLAELKIYAYARYTTEAQIMRANHKIIERMTNIHYPLVKEAKL